MVSVWLLRLLSEMVQAPCCAAAACCTCSQQEGRISDGRSLTGVSVRAGRATPGKGWGVGGGGARGDTTVGYEGEGRCKG